MKYPSRYSRISTLPEIGSGGVAKLNAGKVGIIGCGALGSLCAMYLAAGGVGNIVMADFDTVDISNLQRQLFFTEDDLGKPKVAVLASRIKGINSDTELVAEELLVREENAGDLYGECDVIVDGSDNPSTKLMTDRISARLGIPCVIAGVRGFECQIMTCREGSVRYSDVFGNDPGCNGFTPCSIGGVLGPTAGVAASIQAAEAMKIIAGAGNSLENSLLTINLLDMSTHTFRL